MTRYVLSNRLAVAPRGSDKTVFLVPSIMGGAMALLMFLCHLSGVAFANGGLAIQAENAPEIQPRDYVNRVHVQFMEENQRFGLVCTRLRDPNNGVDPERLTRHERGKTNNTAIRIDGYEYLYGGQEVGTRFIREKGKIVKEVPIPGKDKDRGWMSTWETELAKIRATQSVEIVVGEQTRLYDTALIRYRIVNRDRTPHTVGLRIMLDTFIGTTDGVPFYIPPTTDKPAHFVQTMEIFPQKDIPGFVQALETADFKDWDAVVAVAGLKVKGFEPIEKMVICRWPAEHGGENARWGTGGGKRPGDWPYEPMDKNPNAKDSALVLYWMQANMRPDETRELAFTYGLGRIAGDFSKEPETAGGKMRLFCPRASVNHPFAAFAYIKANDPKQLVKITLPDGIHLAEGEKVEKNVGPPTREGYSQVTWKLTASKIGDFKLKSDAPGIGSAADKITVVEATIFED